MGDEHLKGAYNKAPIFKGDNYAYWKENMYIHLLSDDKNVWVKVTNGSFTPRNEVDNAIKHPND